MSNENHDKLKSFHLEPGKQTEIAVNSPVGFRLVTSGGSTIEGIITANNPLVVTPGHDIEKFEIVIDKGSDKVLRKV